MKGSSCGKLALHVLGSLPAGDLFSYVAPVSDSETLLTAARRIVEGAARDLDRGLYQSACVGAQRGAALATEAWLRRQGQVHVSASVQENVCLSPVAEPDVREAARRLDRHRIDEGSPHRSSPGITDPAGEAPSAVGDARRVLAFVEGRLAAG